MAGSALKKTKKETDTDKSTMSIEVSLVLDCLEQEIIIVSKDFRIIFANEAFLNKLGMKKEDVIGKHCYEVTHHSTSKCKPPKDPCPIEEVIRTGKSAVEVHTHRDKSGKEFLINVIAAPLFQDKNIIEFLHIAIPVKDKTKLKEDILNVLKRVQSILNIIGSYHKQIDELIRERTEELNGTRRELEEKIKELERFNKIFVNRELKMVELKKRIAEVEEKLLKK